MIRSGSIRVRRVYEDPEPDDGVRVLVDRLWPRGVRKDELLHDAWSKEVAPSSELRTWFGHRPERFGEFATRYREELRSGARADALASLRAQARSGTVTLLTATRDVDRSAAAVLADAVRGSGGRPPGS